MEEVNLRYIVSTYVDITMYPLYSDYIIWYSSLPLPATGKSSASPGKE
jgi:hypothetical protein